MSLTETQGRQGHKKALWWGEGKERGQVSTDEKSLALRHGSALTRSNASGVISLGFMFNFVWIALSWNPVGNGAKIREVVHL